jgi:hypothetical protein
MQPHVAFSPRWRPGGQVRLGTPNVLPANYGLLAPVNPVRVRMRQRWRSAPAGFPVAAAPPPPPPPPTSFGLLTPPDPIRGMRWQRWRPATANHPEAVIGVSAWRPITSPRRRPGGRAMLQRLPSPIATASPLRGLMVSVRNRPRAGRAMVARSTPPPPTLAITARGPMVVGSPRRMRPGRVIIAARQPAVPVVLLRNGLRPISSPRRFRPGDVAVPQGAPTPTLRVPLRGLMVSAAITRQRIAASVGRVLLGYQKILPPAASGVMVPVNPVRVRLRQRWRGAISLSSPPVIPVELSAGVRPIRSPRKMTRGRAMTPTALPPADTIGAPLRGLFASRYIPPRRGRVSYLVGQTNQAGPVRGTAGLSVYKPVSSDRRRLWLNRSIKVPRTSPPPDPISLYPTFRPAQLRGDQARRRLRGWTLINTPIPLGGPEVGLGFHVYSNTGIGDPINYVLPIATVFGLTWTSNPLTYPGTWKFGVRAFNDNGEEQNLDCAVLLILDSGGNDITRRPEPPAGLRAFAVAGGSIKVEWGYPSVDRDKLPTAFHVYVGTGGVASYISPVATVAYSSGIAGTYAYTLTGLTDGTVYTIGVRAFNSFAEEANQSTASVAADATGPLPVDSLTGTAT